jgi:LmbE family N-acetylglucosaminyl deacetylase
MVTLTNGDAGHNEMGGAPLARRRRQEAAAAAAVLEAESLVLDNHDGTLLPTLEVRNQVISIMREFEPDLVMTHRPYDYHPDHRYTGQVVQDAINMVIVGNLISDVPPLHFIPVMVYLWDHFQKPYPFIPDVVVGIDEVVEKKVDALHCHVSQMYGFIFSNPPENPGEWRSWLRGQLEPELSGPASLYRDRLIELYGEKKGKRIKYAEAFEVCEYGSPLSDADRKRLFPFFDV